MPHSRTEYITHPSSILELNAQPVVARPGQQHGSRFRCRRLEPDPTNATNTVPDLPGSLLAMEIFVLSIAAIACFSPGRSCWLVMFVTSISLSQKSSECACHMNLPAPGQVALVRVPCGQVDFCNVQPFPQPRRDTHIPSWELQMLQGGLRARPICWKGRPTNSKHG